jgi:extradiol dioxygenase family protein
MSTLTPFHLAIPVSDLDASRSFYCGLLGCATGREDSRWLDLDFFGHQVTLHLVEENDSSADSNPVDGDNIPVRHFGVVLGMDDWEKLASRLADAGTHFRLKPKIRFKGEVGEQATMFLNDPSGNALEFKSFADPARLFAR